MENGYILKTTNFHGLNQYVAKMNRGQKLHIGNVIYSGLFQQIASAVVRTIIAVNELWFILRTEPTGLCDQPSKKMRFV